MNTTSTVPARSALIMSFTILLLGATLLSACSFFGSPQEEPVELGAVPEAASSPTPSPSPRALTVRTPVVWPTPFSTPSTRMAGTPAALTPLATPSPTAAGTTLPTVEPTAATTPTAAPIGQLPVLARSLNDGIAELLAALEAGDTDEALRLQRQLLSEADRVESALEVDPSAQADLARQAIQDIRTGATGDRNRLESAREKLRVASGQPSSPEEAASTGRSPQSVASSLQTKLQAFSDAKNEGRMDTLLRLQQEILADATLAERAIAGQQSEAADRLRSALRDLKSGLSGEDSKLESASVALQAIAGASGRSGSPADTASTRQLLSTAASLDNKLANLREALSGGGRDQLLRAQRELIEELSRAEATAESDSSEEAKQLRDAISLARDGASGDLAKLDGARTRLNDLLGSSVGAPGQPGQANQSARPEDLQVMASELSRKVDSYKDALQRGDRETMLRLQQELIDKVGEGEQAARGVPGSDAEHFRSAMSDLRNALQGDLNKLNSANASLGLVASGPDASRLQPEPQQLQSQETQAAARSLSQTMDQVEAALDSGSADDLERAKDELAKAEESLQELPPAEASVLRSAISAANEALAGDQAKLDVARARLEEIAPR